MWSIIATAVIGALKAIFGLGGKPNEPTAADLAASNATAQTELAHQEAAGALSSKAAVARADAGTSVVRDIATAPDRIDDSASVAALKRDFPSDFRD